MSLPALLESQNPWWHDPDARIAMLYPVRRDLLPRIRDTLFAGSRAVVLGGARQVGKSVLLRQLADEMLDRGWPPGNLTRFDFSDERLIVPGKQGLSARDVVARAPQTLVAEKPRLFLFDEIGRASHWAPWLKQAVDESRASAVKHYYVVTDSAATLLLTDARESGVGRWDEPRLETLSFREYLRFLALADENEIDVLRRFPRALDRYLRVGGFPEHVARDPGTQMTERVRGDVLDRSIRRDLQDYKLDVEQALKLFVYLAQNSGAMFDATKCASLLAVDRRSIQNWLEHLVGMHLLERLDRHPFPPSARLSSRPRIYAADHALIGAFAVTPDPLQEEATRGAVFEAAVFRHLRQDRDHLSALGFYRSGDGQEGDFVLRDGAGRIALIEVTSSTRVRPEKLRQMQEVGAKLKAERRLLVYGGEVSSSESGIDVVPLQSFLLDTARLVAGPARA